MGIGVFLETSENVVEILRPIEVDALESESTRKKVYVAIREAGKNNFASGVDHFCANAAHATDFVVGADRDDLAFVNSDALRPRVLFIGGEDFGVLNNDFGGGNTGGSLGETGGRKKQQRNEEEQFRRMALRHIV